MTGQSVERLYTSAAWLGAGDIVRRYLGLAPDHVLPLAIPHGVDAYLNHVDLDLFTYEPLYLALRPDIAERVSRHKDVLLFPHPWLMMDPLEEPSDPRGTLFVSPPPGEEAFENLYRALLEGDHPRPWGILLKDRGLTEADVAWWRERGFETLTAGSVHDSGFYYRLRAIIAGFERVASANMSSAVIFAAALGKPVLPVPDVKMDLIEVPYVLSFQDFDDAGGTIRRVWTSLMSGDPALSQPQALELLGRPYLDTPEALRRKYLDAEAKLDRKVHLYPMRRGAAQRFASRLVERGVPLHKLFPSPLFKVKTRLTGYFGRDKVAILRGSDLSHYKVAGSLGPLEVLIVSRGELGASVKPGYGVRTKARATAPGAAA